MFRFGITNTGLIRFLSGADESSRIKLIGSNALIGLGAILIAIVLVFVILFSILQLVILVIIYFSNGILC
jgi:hypothetical protein